MKLNPDLDVALKIENPIADKIFNLNTNFTTELKIMDQISFEDDSNSTLQELYKILNQIQD